MLDIDSLILGSKLGNFVRVWNKQFWKRDVNSQPIPKIPAEHAQLKKTLGYLSWTSSQEQVEANL